MEIPRKDKWLVEAIEILDQRFIEANGDPVVAYSQLGKFEIEFIEAEIAKCLDFRYYAENYHVINSKHDGFKTFYPFWDSQEIFFSCVLNIQRAGQPVKIVVIKARQLGLSEITDALVFHRTIFSEGVNAMIVAQDPDQADYLFDKCRFAYENLPWWMRPEARYESKGRYLHFDRRDDALRKMNPGLRSAIFVQAANKMTGVGVGKGLTACHMCLTDKNPVRLKDGFLKSIAEARPGDLVLGRKGFATVTATSLRAANTTGVKVTTWCNAAFPIEGTMNHEVLSCRIHRGAKRFVDNPQLKSLEDLSTRDSLVVDVRQITEERNVPHVPAPNFRRQGGGKREKPLRTPPTNSREWGFAVGLYLAEGSITPTKGGTVCQVCLSLCDDEQHLAERFSVACGVPYGKVSKQKDSKTRIYHFYSAPLARWIFHNFGSKDKKRIPDWCWATGRDFLAGLVEGIICGDGHLVHKTPEIYLTTVRHQLAIQLRDAVLSLGHGYGGIHYRQSGIFYGRNCRERWIVAFGKEPALSMRSEYGWRIPDKIPRNNASHWAYSRDKSFVAVRIRSVDRIPLGLVYDIEVDSADHLFALPSTLTHNSELSLWPEAKVLAEQLFPTLSENAEQIAVMESTARGRKNFWHDFWKDSMAGKTGWTPVFIEFFRVKKYSLPIPKHVTFERTKDEISLAHKVFEEKQVQLSNEQLYWRRNQMQVFASLNRGDESKFYQEYPGATWQEAFQGSGICAFNKKRLQLILETTCAKPPLYGEIDLKRNKLEEWYPEPRLTKLRSGQDPPIREGYGGRLWVWEEPIEGETYVVGGDVAQGLQGGDFSVAQVLRIGRGPRPDEQVAEWHGWMNPTPFGDVCAALGYWYNGAMLSIECNDIGMATFTRVRQVIQYPNLFRWKNYDKIKNLLTDFLGWYTNVKTRPMIISKFREYMDDNMVVLRSEELIDECFDFAQDEGSLRIEGQSGNDDLVMAMQIAVYTAHDTEGWFGDSSNAKPRREDPNIVCICEHTKDMHGDGKLAANCRVEGCRCEVWRQKVDYLNTEYSPVYDDLKRPKPNPNEGEPVPMEVGLYTDMQVSQEDLWKLY